MCWWRAQLGRLICQAQRTQSLVEVATAHAYPLGNVDGDTASGFAAASCPNSSIPAPAAGASPDHPLFGKNVCISGTLSSMTRREAHELAARCGAQCSGNVSKKTNLLVTGMTDFARVKDGMSSKLRKAVELAESGHDLEIVNENDFLQMLNEEMFATT